MKYHFENIEEFKTFFTNHYINSYEFKDIGYKNAHSSYFYKNKLNTGNFDGIRMDYETGYKRAKEKEEKFFKEFEKKYFFPCVIITEFDSTWNGISEYSAKVIKPTIKVKIKKIKN